MSVLRALSYPPILRGLLILLVAGSLFPLTGVFVVRLNLITLRFMLMHGTLLGGAIALGFGLDPLSLGIAIDVLLVLAVAWFSRSSGLNAGYLTTFFMVITIGLAFAVIYRTGVPAKDALSILWGSLFALRETDLILTLAFSLASLLFVLLLYRRLKAVLFDREVAYSSGVPERVIYNAILVITGLTIAFAMKLIGALLLDSILLLPALVASFFARSSRGMFLLAAAVGFFCSLAGFFVSLAVDIPASSGVTIVAALTLGGGFVVRRLSRP